jgi:hypothetical protein
MKPYIFLFLSLSLAWTSCFQDCTPQDVKVGDIALMPTTKAFIQQFVNKKVVFKNESGREIIFKAPTQGSFNIDSDQVLIKQNCNAGFFGNQKSWDFYQTEGMSIDLTSDSFFLGYRTWMTQDFTKKRDTSALFEVMTFSAYEKAASCGVSPIAIFSDRGFPARRTDTSDTYRRYREVKDTTIGGKRFQNINLRAPTSWCNATDVPSNQTPIELYFNFKKGIVAFKTKNEVFWFFDRIE